MQFIHEITNVAEVRLDFHKLLSKYLAEFKDGSRDPENEQDIIRLVLRFRSLSQEWEARADKGHIIRDFWKDCLDREIEAASGKTEFRTLKLDLSGADYEKIEMVQIPAGAFLMGSELDLPIHRVKITKPFMIASVPVTQALYWEVTGDRPSKFEGGDKPVINVNWLDAVEFCNSLSKRLNLVPAYRIDRSNVACDWKHDGFRLPTAAEWEYACRAGTTTQFACGDLESDLETMGWYNLNSGYSLQSVKCKSPNAWGIFDMHGNVWEWVWNLYGEYPGIPHADHKEPKYSRGLRVICGGSWTSGALTCRSAIKRFSAVIDSHNDVSFRLARSVALGP